MKLKVADTEFNVKVASTPEQRAKGLLNIKAGSMPSTAGLVLKFDTPTPAVITMKGMKFPLDLIFIKDGQVQKVVSAEPEGDDVSINDVSDYVLEVPKGSAKGLKVKDKIDWVGEKKEDGTIQMAEGGAVAAEGAMQVLDENGKVQSNIEGDERIFSRKHTERLYSLAEKAHESQSDNDYKKLGMAMMQMIDKQDTQKQEYTKN
jgi:uncharacterized membrane protein (UPF0127 family)